MKHGKPYYLRDIILKQQLLKFIDDVPVIKRNKELVVDYASGMDYAALLEKYGTCNQQVHQIVGNYIIHCRKIQKRQRIRIN